MVLYRFYINIGPGLELTITKKLEPLVSGEEGVKTSGWWKFGGKQN